MKRLVLLILSGLLLSFSSTSLLSAETRIRCASTTSTQNSGLLDYILPVFEKKTGLKVDVVAVGTGASIEIGKRGDCDVVLVHARELELKAVVEGFFVDRHDVMYNNFVLIGPANDPLKIKGITSAVGVIKKIAVMDFTSPSSNAEAGRIVTDSLLSYLTTNATSDVKILARDVMGAILKEIEMGQAGVYDTERAKKAGKLKGTDIFIFGSVLQYNVEKQTSEGQKMTNVVVAKKLVPNPSYQMWLMSQKGSASDPNAPPATIEEEIRETVRYKVGTEKKRAFIRVSYRLIDVEGGEVIATRNIQKVKEVSDDFSEGIPQANIPYDPLQIPADTELLDLVTQDIVTDLGKQVLGYFSSPQTLYMRTAETLGKKRDYEKAVEKYIDAITLEEMKNITGPLTTRANQEIDLIMNTLAK